MVENFSCGRFACLSKKITEVFDLSEQTKPSLDSENLKHINSPYFYRNCKRWIYDKFDKKNRNRRRIAESAIIHYCRKIRYVAGVERTKGIAFTSRKFINNSGDKIEYSSLPRNRNQRISSSKKVQGIISQYLQDNRKYSIDDDRIEAILWRYMRWFRGGLKMNWTVTFPRVLTNIREGRDGSTLWIKPSPVENKVITLGWMHPMRYEKFYQLNRWNPLSSKENFS